MGALNIALQSATWRGSSLSSSSSTNSNSLNINKDKDLLNNMIQEKNLNENLKKENKNAVVEIDEQKNDNKSKI